MGKSKGINRKWSEDDKRIIKEHYIYMNDEQLADVITIRSGEPVSKVQVSACRKSLGLIRRK